jgi:hypothetical protein
MHPTSAEIEHCLKGVAREIGDTTESPFRVDVVAQYGGKPPLYTVVIRSAEKEPIRRNWLICSIASSAWGARPSR